MGATIIAKTKSPLLKGGAAERLGGSYFFTATGKTGTSIFAVFIRLV